MRQKERQEDRDAEPVSPVRQNIKQPSEKEHGKHQVDDRIGDLHGHIEVPCSRQELIGNQRPSVQGDPGTVKALRIVHQKFQIERYGLIKNLSSIRQKCNDRNQDKHRNIFFAEFFEGFIRKIHCSLPL